jgi:putative transposase
MTINERRKGWLDSAMHSAVREALLHTLGRYHLACPVYTLMPDHAHMIWWGCAAESDQMKASSFFRREWNSALRMRGVELQRQPYEHVLLESERNQDEFEDTCVYLMQNPERAGLVQEWRDWKFLGSLVPGFPRIDAREDRFWAKFWTIYNEIREPGLL